MALRTNFPLLAAGSNGELLVVGGGGGSAKTGVKNSLKLCPLASDGIGETSIAAHTLKQHRNKHTVAARTMFGAIDC